MSFLPHGVLTVGTYSYTFKDAALVAVALTHRSFGTPHNERLEFLGDSVLNCVIATELYARFPLRPEGDLSRLRAAFVSQPSLVEVAEALKLGDTLRLGDGEWKSGGHRRPSILADAVEAMIGAVYVDGGFEEARRVTLALLADRLVDPEAVKASKDPKTALQEWLQGKRLPLPIYEIAQVAGAAHLQTFHIRCCVPSLAVEGEGSGVNRRAAEQAAAAKVLQQLPLSKRKST